MAWRERVAREANTSTDHKLKPAIYNLTCDSRGTTSHWDPDQWRVKREELMSGTKVVFFLHGKHHKYPEVEGSHNGIIAFTGDGIECSVNVEVPLLQPHKEWLLKWFLSSSPPHMYRHTRPVNETQVINQRQKRAGPRKAPQESRRKGGKCFCSISTFHSWLCRHLFRFEMTLLLINE